MAGKVKPKADDGLMKPGETSVVSIEKRDDEKLGRTLARLTLDPQTRHANTAMSFGSQVFGDRMRPDITETSAVLAEEIALAMQGSTSLADRMFTSQAITLDTLFTEMARRAGNNLGQYPETADRYMRLALKAQAACRATLEAQAKLHQPREQTVKHVHVSEGGQTVVADHFHQHRGDRENGKSGDQSHATGAAGQRAALPSPDPIGNRVSITSRERKAAMQDARRD